MAAADHSTPAPVLRDERRGLTYERATPEQVIQTREHMRTQLAAADARRTPEEREQRRTAFLDRIDAAA